MAESTGSGSRRTRRDAQTIYLVQDGESENDPEIQELERKLLTLMWKILEQPPTERVQSQPESQPSLRPGQ